jgi:cell division protein ZapA
MDAGSERKTVRVTIYNQSYTLAATGDSSDIEELARSVDDLMTQIAQRAGNIDSNRVAVLACLHLADRLRAAEGELTGLRARIGEKSREFSLLLDQVIE